MRTLSLALALLATPALAQDAVTLTPGHPDLSVDAITLAGGTVEVRMVEPQPQTLGTVTESVTLDGGVLTVVSLTEIPMAGPDTRDSTRLAWPSLTPLSNDVTTGDKVGSATYADGTVTGTYGSGSGPLPFDFELRQPVFPTAALPYILRALPLDRTGYVAMVPTFSAEDRFKEATFTVVGLEAVTLDDGSVVDAVAVDQVGGGGPTQGFSQRHYLDPATREIVLSTMAPPNGMVIRMVPVTAEEVAAAAAAEAAERAAASQNKLMPGADVLAAAPAQSTTFKVLLTAPMQQDLGTVATTETIADGRLVLTSDVQIPQAGQDQQDTTVVAYPSLMPVSRVEIKPGETEQATFADGRMTGTTMQDGEAVAVDAALGDAFGPGITRRIIRSLPFAEGYTASFEQIDGEGDVDLSTVRVTGQETYSHPDGTERTVWIVVESEDGAPDYEYAVDAETRELLRIAFAPQPGARIEMVAQ